MFAFLCIIVICKICNCGLILHKSKRMWNNMGALRTQKFSSATHNEKCVTVTQKKWRIFWPKFHTKFCVIYTWQFLQCSVRIVEGFGNIVTVGCQGESITTVAWAMGSNRAPHVISNSSGPFREIVDPPHEVFHGSTIAVPHPPVFIT